MDLRLTPEQRQLVDAFAGLYAKHASPEQVRAAEPLGFDRALWAQLQELGVVAMAVDPAGGGWGASPLDLALVAEQQGRALAPAPVVEAQVAARLLARLVGGTNAAPGAATTGTAAATAALEATLAGERLVTLALHPVRHGRAGLVPAAAVADDVVVLDGSRLLLVPLDGARRLVENLGAMPVADVDVARALAGPGVGAGGVGAGVTATGANGDGATRAGTAGDGTNGEAPGVAAGPVVLAEGPEALAVHDAAVDDFLRLTAAALVGIGTRALEMGVGYARERKAWGVPIGSFQAVAHRLADSATALDGARLLAYEAAWAVDGEPARAAELAAMAFAFAAESARDTTSRSLHFHGGYGFTMEHDVQLYYRRARAWAGVYAEPRQVYRRAADRRAARQGRQGQGRQGEEG